MQLFKVAEFLNDYFQEKYCKNIFQMRCQWCCVQLDQAFFNKLNTVAKCKDKEQRMLIMQELHIYVEDFLIAFSEKFFSKIDKESQTLLIYAADFLHHKMSREKLEKFFYISGLLK